MFPSFNILGCKKSCPVIKEYINYLEILNSRDYTSEIDFCGDINRYLYALTQKGRMSKISGCFFGAKDAADNNVDIDRLMGSTYVDFDPRTIAIYLPEDELLKRTKFGWFVRLSQQQLTSCDAIAAKWLLIAQEKQI